VLYRAFLQWKSFVKIQKKLEKLKKVAQHHRGRSLLKMCLSAWRQDTFNEKRRKLDFTWQNKMEKVSNNIISQYESELARVVHFIYFY
jgi:hypothetical protein